VKVTQRSIAVTTIAAAILAVSQAHAASSNITDDPSYHNYLRWNGFSDSTASTSAQTETSNQAAVEGSDVGAPGERSYLAYQRLNGFSVPDAVATTRVTQSEDPSASRPNAAASSTALADPSYIAYERLNGLL
jgi:hypothetical protein